MTGGIIYRDFKTMTFNELGDIYFKLAAEYDREECLAEIISRKLHRG
jgi:hypothetical protein